MRFEDAVARDEREWAERERQAMLAERAEQRRAERITASGLPPHLQGTSLPHTALGRIAREWADEEIPGLCLTGGVGVGKTYLAAAACWHRLQRKTCKWVSVARMMTQLRASFDDDSRKAAIRSVVGGGAAILDDLDKVNPTEYGKEVLFAAINGRIETGAPLLVTTNLTPTQLGQKLGAPIMSRVAGLEVVRMSGADRRVA